MWWCRSSRSTGACYRQLWKTYGFTAKVGDMNVRWTWRKGLILTVVLLAAGAVAFWFSVSPAHWFRRVDFGAVRVDGKPVDADIFFAEPNGEAEAIALVRLKDGRDYFLDFGSEKWRPANKSEYVRLFAGVWSLRSMPESLYPEREQLPVRNLNEFRIPARDGHEVSVQF